MKREDLIGKRYSKWTVLRYVGNRGWLCRCECGKEKSVTTQNLKSGGSTQCFDCANKLPLGEANFNDKLSNIKGEQNKEA